MSKQEKDNSAIIKKRYLELLCRNPDKIGFEHYLHLMDTGHLDEEGLINNIKSSDEYKNMPKFIIDITELGNDTKGRDIIQPNKML